MTCHRLASLAWILILGACTPEVCEVANLPFLGQPTSPEELFELAQYAGTNDCCGVLYGLLSEHTKAEHSETKFCLFWESFKIPEPFNYMMIDVVSKGEYLGVLAPDPFGRRFIFVHYQEPEGPSLDAQLYFVIERDAQGKQLPRLALQEQLESQGGPRAMPFAQEPAK